ncbi:ATP-binding cassette sub-family B member 6-like [Tubulanus polymorphus]|uniref:ATP-binding cassette sub-family B member 6-like n=1 Tax=Tubulanus polymorphus TaxID=672921 RepID=UPI003DA5CBA5
MKLLVFWSLCFLSENLTFINWMSPLWWWNLAGLNKVRFGLWLARYISTTFTFTIFVLARKSPAIPRRILPDRRLLINADEEQAALIQNDITDNGFQEAPLSRSTWAGIVSKIRMIYPFVWPKGHLLLQMRVLLCMLVLIAGRVVNLLVPVTYKKSVDYLTLGSQANFRWGLISLFVFLKFLQGSGGGGTMGLLNNIRSFFWIRIEQFTTKMIQTKLFDHLHGLSLNWHLNRNTGEVLKILDRGTNSINLILDKVLFKLLPTVVDITIAIVYFAMAFNAWYALIVAATMLIYITTTIGMTEWRSKFRRTMNECENDSNTRAVDSLINHETVKYYCGEEFELETYSLSIDRFQSAEWTSNATVILLNNIQNIVIHCGFLLGSIMMVHNIVYEGDFTVGDFVLFVSYIRQLYTPLNYFGTQYRVLQQSFIDMENMFDLMNEKQDIVDDENARDLVLVEGRIDVKDVCFRYNQRELVLKDITFSVPPGETYALVGPSGSGKSTLIKLLFRFYEAESGSIKIDRQDITKVTQKSLRMNIGVVPQDTNLFNADIKYNIRYGRVTADDDDVIDSAEAANIHPKIICFPKQYETQVGERGLKLSGGEKQRVAIARTILKSPAIILLDEATSALDTQTERAIQTSLSNICENRTTIIVAHRLSTVVHADQILVLKNGRIVERGRHEELLAAGDVYASMWELQQSETPPIVVA